MRWVSAAAMAALMAIITVGCERRATFDGPTVDKFDGKLVHQGKPVAFPDGEKVQLKAFHSEKGQSFGIPIKNDGTFNVGWMPIGKYSAQLIREKPNAKGAAASQYNVPGGFEIKDADQEYIIELGKGFKL